MRLKKLPVFKSSAVIILLCLMSFSWAGDKGGVLKADIHWTAYGIPHIKANDEHGLGYGIGYVYARDNACLLMDEVTTARGERSRYFGAKGESSTQLNNVTSDFFFTWLNADSEIKVFWDAQSAPIQQLLLGYAAGFNRFLDEADVEAMSCFGEDWVHSITYKDLVGLTRRLLVEGGVGQFAESVVGAEPPKSWWEWIVDKVAVVTTKTAAEVATNNVYKQGVQATWNGRLELGVGSNGIAVGSKRSDNGKGMLLANPHFPWHGALRFYQMHLTIPGQLDVMGAALPGFPLINIGFNQHVAWTHTVDTSSHFTLYRLTLDPEDVTRYLVDGKSYPLHKKTLQVQVRNDKGELSTVTHVLYESKFGPLVTWPGMLEWNKQEAFALRDANLGNTRVLQQWYAINQAEDALALRDSVEKIQGIPWVNTIASDDRGHALYMNQSVVPYLLEEQLLACSIPELVAEGLPGLQGNRSSCDWHVDQATAQAGITPSGQLPTLLRDDFVQNSNDSAWQTNPNAPVEGYSPLVTREGSPLGLRTRFALGRLQGDTLLTADFMEKMVTDNHAYLADLVLADLLTFCSQQKDDESLHRACSSLERWDGSASLNSGLGFVYFNFFMHHFNGLEAGWRVPFDSQDPLNTPRGIALENASVVKAIRRALNEGDAQIKAWDISDDVRWGDIQVATRGDRKVSLPGGEGDLGIYNVIESRPQQDAQQSLLEVVRGSSYLQLVVFNDEGPQARGLLAFSQSSEPNSPHYSDQTQLFSRQEWPVLPFTEAKIKADSAIEHKELWLH